MRGIGTAIQAIHKDNQLTRVDSWLFIGREDVLNILRAADMGLIQPQKRHCGFCFGPNRSMSDEDARQLQAFIEQLREFAYGWEVVPAGKKWYEIMPRRDI